MATRGRKPKPTALKVLEGNPGKRPLNDREPVPPKATLKCPAWLLPEAKKEWKRLAPALEAMGVLTMADLTAFEGYCQASVSYTHLDVYKRQGEALPDEFLQALEDPDVLKIAHNAAFERVCFSRHLGHWLCLLYTSRCV